MGCPPSSGAGEPDDNASSDDDASATVNTPEEFTLPMAQNPDVLQQNMGGSSNDNTTILTTHSGWVVKPAQCFGWT